MKNAETLVETYSPDGKLQKVGTKVKLEPNVLDSMKARGHVKELKIEGVQTKEHKIEGETK